jgi:hypothetical protein
LGKDSAGKTNLMNETIIHQTDGMNYMINAASNIYTQIKSRIYFYTNDKDEKNKYHKKYFDLSHPYDGVQVEGEPYTLDGAEKTINGFVFSNTGLEYENEDSFVNCFKCE